MSPAADNAPSSTNSKQSSIRSVDVASSKSPVLAPQHGSAAVPAVDSLSRLPEKASIKDRLTRMFSQKEDLPRSAPLSADSAATSKRSTPSATPSTANGATTPPKPVAPARKPSTTDAPASSRTATSQRYIVNPDVPGGHEHHLKGAKRQEKLSDMWKSLLGKKHEDTPAADLSLVSNWVDTIKQEKEAIANDRKGGPNASTTLVEKYGKCQEVVGRGAFGIVRISHKKLGNGEKLFAVKEFRRRPEETEKKYSKRLTAEFCISSSLRHPNVIHTLDLLKDQKGDYCEVMEFCSGGDLYTLVLAAGKLEVLEADCYFKQMMRGVEYMHEMGVAHRDLKPENLLLTAHGALKITDFGNGECFRMAWENDAHMVTGLCGSAPYIAPEEYVDREFDARAVDVWACGVIYMAMRTGRHLWRVARKDEDEFYERYLEGRRDEEGYGPIESLHRARCRNVIYSILDPNPSRRITASQVLKSEWGREIKLSTTYSEFDNEFDHEFGNDSIFWITYEDMLENFQHVDRTRLFKDKDWRMRQRWIGVEAPWKPQWNEKFTSRSPRSLPSSLSPAAGWSLLQGPSSHTEGLE
ncbi:kinase-like domain-containing protein [Microdochium trichocladiopsis]|uniref:non-specific serine/threonine protein kinase n=1 Tax=Microdochium trichocladiopsis TaxID=1682393 RepID=A0A9P8YJD4_9PEZI|nr:kinase-like domain-containing protein [Microdochium trichocladiopsis]KAH7040983.1 kinase-like domain-containing protein [Microdochium trichocladiopsis]